tara:strand:+ start:6473 stop:6739 length:267 start_codon:yes stop_codon:yes gene_type:complete
MDAFGKPNLIKMNWNDFEASVRETLEIEDDVVIDKNELLENSEYWSSMHALLIMALAESEYEISITGEELRNAKTLQDLYNLFESKQA